MYTPDDAILKTITFVSHPFESNNIAEYLAIYFWAMPNKEF